MGEFDGSVALITGATSGLGAVVAAELLAEGAHVAFVGRDESALSRAVRDHPGSALAVAADVTSAADVERAVGETVDRFGGLDLLVNAAGTVRRGALDQLPEADWDLVFETNVKSCFLLLKHAIPAMRERGGGAVVNVSSVLGQAANPGTAAYAASKAAVIALTKAAALDHVGEGIRINCVAPGTMATPMLEASARQLDPDGAEALLEAAARAHPIGRLVEPLEVARLILFLLSRNASGIVGSCYAVDGGRLAKLGVAGRL